MSASQADGGRAPSGREVTEQQQAERALLASIVESASVAIIAVTPDGRIISWNRAAEALYGYTAQEILGQQFAGMLAQDQRKAEEIIARVMQGERIGLHEARRQYKDGRIIDVSASQSPIFDQTGTIIGVASLERSLSEETQLEQELQQAQAHIQGLIESSVDAMLTVNSDLVITDVNEHTVKLIGTKREVLIGSRFDSFFTDPERAAQGMRRALSEGSIANYELAVKAQDGRLTPVAFNASVFRQPSGEVGGIFVVARDITPQKQTEEDLRQAHAYTRGLIESSIDPMLTVNSDLVITDVNEHMAMLTEAPKTMLIGSRFDSFFIDPERAASGVQLTLKEGAVTNYDLLLRTISGRTVLVSFNASILYDTDGKMRGVFAVVRDVTEQRHIEQQLRDQQNYNRGLIEASIDALLTIDHELNITDVNQQSVELTGYSRQELRGSSFAMLFTDPERAAEIVHKTLADGFVKNYELTLQPVSGAEVLVSINASVLKDAHGNVRGIFAAARDVSERERVERERSLLASIVTSTSDAIYSYSNDLTVLSWNAGAEKLFGYSAQEMIGRSLIVLIPLERKREMYQHLNQMRQKRKIEQINTQRRRKDGSIIDIALTMSPITDKAGDVIAVAAIARDTTERMRYELELTKARDEALEATQARSNFLANMSHEIRTPLNSITGMAEILSYEGLSSRQRSLVEGICQSAENLLTIINDVLDFSKLTAGKLLLQNNDFDLEEVVYQTLKPFVETARAKGLEVVASIETNTPHRLRGDPARLSQVLANLLSNAVKFTEHGEIDVGVSKLGELPAEAILRFEVRDTGIGIAREVQSRLFNAFVQADKEIARDYGGTGLGLTISRQLVEQMNGSIGVISTPAAGSTFWFNAKFGKQPAASKQPPPVVPNLEGMRLLIIDDNAISRGALKAQFVFWKMAPDVASAPGEGLEMMLREAKAGYPYRLAVLDMEMPEMNGIELARRIRRSAEVANTPLIILSAVSGPANLDNEIAELDLRAFMLKPVRPSDLIDCMTETLVAHPDGATPPRRENKEPGQIEPITGAQGAPLRVLLAEDNAANQEVALWQLRRLGCVAKPVKNGFEVLEALARDSYDVILMDCRMPKMDGYEATRKVRQQEGSARHIPIIAMTAHALSGDKDRCLAAGMDDYISKPVALKTLASVLRRVTGTARVMPSVAANASDEQANGAQWPAAEPAPEAPALEPGTIASLRAKGDLLPKLIDTALGEIPEQLKQLAEALARRAYTDVAITAHSLKGTARIFGAAQMADIAASLEQAADAEADEKAMAELGRLKEECDRVSRELKREKEKSALDIN